MVRLINEEAFTVRCSRACKSIVEKS